MSEISNCKTFKHKEQNGKLRSVKIASVKIASAKIASAKIASAKIASAKIASIIKRVSWFKSSLLLRIQSDSFTNINS